MPHPRHKTITWLPGHYYHIYNRGARQLTIFREPANYHFVLGRIKKYSYQFNLTIIAYCLMPNHYHLLIRQNAQHNAGLLPQRVFNSYTKAYNKRYGHSGTLFQGRYKAKHVDSDAYLHHLCRYIHANPVKDGFVAHPGDWLYSNYLDWLGERPGTLIDRGFMKDHFPDLREYAAFVLDYVRTREEQDSLNYLDNFTKQAP